MTDNLIKRAREALDGVTPGPGDSDWFVRTDHPDARFIAAARDLVPAMIDRIEALEAEVARLREAKPVAVKVKPLEWDGFVSGCYMIEVNEEGIANLWRYSAEMVAAESPELICGGYLTLANIGKLKAAAQADYEARILAALDVQPGFTADDHAEAAQTIVRRVLDEASPEAVALRERMISATMQLRLRSLTRWDRWAIVNLAIRALTPPADLADKVKEGRDNG